MRTTLAALTLFVCLIVPAPAHAGSIVVGDFLGVAVGYFSPVTSGVQFAILGSVPMRDGTGVSPAIDGLAFEAYCVDIHGPIFDPGTPQPPATFDATAASMTHWHIYPDAQAAAGQYASWLYEEFAAGIAAGPGDLIGRTALLMAIWNVLYDTDFSVATGVFGVSSEPQFGAVRTRADQFLGALDAHRAEALLSDATWLQLQDCSVSPCRPVQGFIGPDQLPKAVPEPGSVLLLALGFTAIAFAKFAA